MKYEKTNICVISRYNVGDGIREGTIIVLPQQITELFNRLPESEVRALLIEIFITRNYGNQEMIQTLNDIATRYDLV